MEFEFESAVDQFRKQFAHLEENGGKSGPVIPLERKHVSHPTYSEFEFGIAMFCLAIVWYDQQLYIRIQYPQKSNQALIFTKISKIQRRHTTEVPGKLKLRLLYIFKNFAGTRKNAASKTKKCSWPCCAYENGTIMKDAYDPRTFIRGTVLPPQAVHPAYTYHKSSTGKQEKSTMDSKRELVTQTKQVSQCGMAAKISTDIAINIDSNPFFMTRVNKVEPANHRITIDTNLLQTKVHYAKIGFAAATAIAHSHRKFGTVQYGMTRMY
ncbi:hypothetical protein COLO4_06053 [Corchorus olitorius]|uniref:Uncharacterized protein n=1 Tax=Corchorus olitorius TaxID=93759 RepID=A0A1R3KP69_9ROSI|nr:hypothetical protein COLO4_06053 [Corchorus olitorius]